MEGSEYYGSELAVKDAEDARRQWKPTATLVGVDTVYVEASAGTGSRYTVVVTKLPDFLESDTLVAVLAPWKACKETNRMRMGLAYAMEHLRDPKREFQHMGDMEALLKTVNYAMERNGELLPE